MKKLEVVGGKKLSGILKISGSKNASLPILAASLLSKKKIELINLPQVQDIKTMISLLKSLGSKITYNDNKVIINNNNQLKKFVKWKPKFNNLGKIVKSCISWEKKIN